MDVVFLYVRERIFEEAWNPKAPEVRRGPLVWGGSRNPRNRKRKAFDFENPWPGQLLELASGNCRTSGNWGSLRNGMKRGGSQFHWVLRNRLLGTVSTGRTSGSTVISTLILFITFCSIFETFLCIVSLSMFFKDSFLTSIFVFERRFCIIVKHRIQE